MDYTNGQPPQPTRAPQALLARAERYLRSRRAPCPPEEVAREVFGLKGGVNAAWVACLRAALTERAGFTWNDDRVGLRAWSSGGREVSSAQLLLISARPAGRGCLAELVALSVTNGSVEHVFARHLLPEPGSQRRWNEPDDEWELATAGDATEALDQLCAGAELVVAADAAQVQALCPELRWPRLVDLPRLAEVLIPGLKRPDLRSVACALSLPASGRQRRDDGLSRALLALASFALLAERALEAGMATLEEIEQAVAGRQVPLAQARRALAGARQDLDAASRGAYVMRDAAGEALYVGKAVRLEQRLAAYASLAHNAARRLEGLLGAVEQVEVVPAEGDEEALRLEGWLIEQLRPRYNVQRRRQAPRRYVAIDRRVDFPTLRPCSSAADDGRLYVGPLTGNVDVLLRRIKREHQLHSCTRSLPGKGATAIPCYRAAIGQCLAPCDGRLAPERYQDAVKRALEDLMDAATSLATMKNPGPS